MAGLKSTIADALVGKIQNVTVANSYSQDLKTVVFDKVRLNIADYQDYQLPAVQVIDLSTIFKHEMSRSLTSWFVVLEICMRTTETIGTVDQKALWDLEEDVKRAVFQDPKLGLGANNDVPIVHALLVDAQTDLHVLEPNYIATLGLEIKYYEPITRDNC